MRVFVCVEIVEALIRMTLGHCQIVSSAADAPRAAEKERERERGGDRNGVSKEQSEQQPALIRPSVLAQNLERVRVRIR